jgi:23S rRNA pseudouridine2605 synthase
MDENETPSKDGERIAKAIARAGLASRREAEQWIAAGRVAVNGATINSPAHNVTAQDRVTVDGEDLPARERTRLFLYHKPRGLMTTHSDPQGRPTIFQRLPKGLPRLISVGRLDLTTEGLLLLTNDGALARVLELPETGWLRRYRVRAHGTVTQPQLESLRDGITISGIHYGAIDAALDRVQGSNLWLTFAIREGKNREVRNVLGHLGLMVTRLIRVSFGPFQLGELAEGAVEEVRTRVLREQLGARVAALARADFSRPVAPHSAGRTAARANEKPRQESRKELRQEPRQKSRQIQRPNPANHAWRTRDEERPSKFLQRKFRGARRDDRKTNEASVAPGHKDTLTDRKGRRVAVLRHAPARDAAAPDREPPRNEPTRGPPNQFRKPKGDRSKSKRSPRRASDRASGPRPRHPRGR